MHIFQCMHNGSRRGRLCCALKAISKNGLQKKYRGFSFPRVKCVNAKKGKGIVSRSYKGRASFAHIRARYDVGTCLCGMRLSIVGPKKTVNRNHPLSTYLTARVRGCSGKDYLLKHVYILVIFTINVRELVSKAPQYKHSNS